MHFFRDFSRLYIFKPFLTLVHILLLMANIYKVEKKVFANDVVYLALPFFLVLLPFEQLCSKRQWCTLAIACIVSV